MHPQPAKGVQETVMIGSGSSFSWDERDCLLGRVVGCPGDSIELIKGNLYINKQPWNERYLLPAFRSDADLPLISLRPSQYCVLPEDRRLIDTMRDEIIVDRTQILGREIVARWPLGWWIFQPNIFLQPQPSK
jgi:hypothetical protein